MKIDKKFWIRLAVAGVLIATIVILATVVSDLRYKLKISEHNFDAATSELTETKLKNDKLLYEKQAYILSEKDLLDQLDISKSEMKELKKKLSDQSVYISKLEGEIRIDTVYTRKDSLIYIDNTPATNKFKYEDPWLSFNGISNLKDHTTSLQDIYIPVPLTLGITKAYSIFVESGNPYLQVTDINAVAVEDFVKKAEKKRKWTFGASFGLGIHYDLIHNNLGLGPGCMVSINYNF